MDFQDGNDPIIEEGTEGEEEYKDEGYDGRELEENLQNMHSVGSAEQMIQEYSWSKVTPQGYRLTPRGGHSAVVADYQLIVFGGTSYDGGGKFSYLNDTCVLDVETMTWQLVRCGGNLPAPRYGHACELVGSRMFVLGGKGKGGEGGGGCFRDVHALDLVDWVWVPINATSTGPSPRFNAASAAVGRKIVVHGGWDGEAACLGDLWVFDTDSFAWVQPRVGGLPPSPRYGHTLTLLPDGRLLALGGAAVPAPGAGAVAPQYLEDLRQLDTETMAWSKPARAGEKLSGRFGHTTTLLDSSALFIFGGWGLGGLQEKATNNRDGAHSVCAIGIEGNEARYAVPALRSRKAPEHRYGQTCTRVGSMLLVFGGWNGQQALSDLIAIETQ